MIRALVLGLTVAYVLHRWVPRITITWPVVATFVGLVLAVRLLSLL